MKFLVITDLHQKCSALQWINAEIEKYQPDAVLVLGDITDMGSSEDAIDILEKINSEVYAIPGNCDPLDFADNITHIAHDMHGKSANIGELYIAGVGGSNPTIFSTPFELPEDELYSMLKPISKKNMIMMVHVPAYGILDEIPSGINVGSTGVKKIVDEFEPILVLSGHIHEAIGVKKINNTVFVNPGPARDGYSAIVSIENNEIDVKLLGPLDGI